MSAEEALANYESRIWARAVRAMPKGHMRRRLFRFAWQRHWSPPYPGVTPARVLLLMTLIEVRNVRAWERGGKMGPRPYVSERQP